jgi:tRNA pseudouridine38-40 synthase
MRYALKFGYLGHGFSGYARQPDQMTVEGDIIKALLETKIVDNMEESQLRVASRTDSGVSALGNVLALNSEFPKEGMVSALNSHLEDIWFYGIIERDANFNSRHAKSRKYRYHLLEGDIDSIRKTAEIFIGQHNFSNFAKLEGNDPVRTIDAITVYSKGDLIILDFTAQSYLWHMIRRMVSAILKVELGKITCDDIESALSVEEKFDFGLVSPYPLVLVDVVYDFNFEVVEPNLGSLEENLDSKLHDLKFKIQILEDLKNKIK